MKNLQKNNPTIGAQYYNLVDKANNDIYIYGSSPEINQIVFYKRADYKGEEPVEQLPQAKWYEDGFQYIEVTHYGSLEYTNFSLLSGTSTYELLTNSSKKLYQIDLTDQIKSSLPDGLSNIYLSPRIPGYTGSANYRKNIVSQLVFLDPLTLYAESIPGSEILIPWGSEEISKPDKVEFQLEGSTLKITYVK